LPPAPSPASPPPCRSISCWPHWARPSSRRATFLILLLPIAAIGLLERHGLEHAQASIARIRSATTGRLLIVYLAIRELSGVRPDQHRRPSEHGAPADRADGGGRGRSALPNVPQEMRYRIRAMAAATDNVGLFFGEDIFVAFGAIVLMQTILRGEGLEVDPLHMALWGIPTAVCAFIIHSWRLYRWMRRSRGAQHDLKLDYSSTCWAPCC
jgi:uncharacterized membrane protein